MSITIGDIYEVSHNHKLRHEVIQVEPTRVQLKALGNGYKFWLNRSTVEKYWLTNLVEVGKKNP